MVIDWIDGLGAKPRITSGGKENIPAFGIRGLSPLDVPAFHGNPGCASYYISVRILEPHRNQNGQKNLQKQIQIQEQLRNMA